MSKKIKGLGTLHEPQFKIHGKERKEVIKKRNLLRSYLKLFDWNVSIDNDMFIIYGEPERVLSAEKQKEIKENAQKELEEIEKRLREPYIWKKKK